MANSAPTALNLPHNAFVHPEACVCVRDVGHACVCDDGMILSTCMCVCRQTVLFELLYVTHAKS